MKTGFIFCAASVLCLMASCGPRNTRNTTAETTETISVMSVADDSTRITVNPADIDRVSLIFAEPETEAPVYLSEEDRRTLFRLLASAVYDTEWNDSGIMVKMVAPDYSLVVSYKGRSQDENDWLSIWKEGGRIKFREKWFLPDARDAAPVYGLLETYR